MHQAQVTEWGSPPKYVEVPPLPAPGPDEMRIKVTAVGCHQLVRSRAAGTHYSSKGLPHTPGVDGTGTTEDGKKVFFVDMTRGTFSEEVNMPKNNVTELPERLDPVQTAALLNPAMSSYMALSKRTTNLTPGFTALILGATSQSGRIAIGFARRFGAKKVIGVARNREALETLDLDDRVVIAKETSETDFSTLGDVDVILDYIYGPATAHLFKSLKSERPTQYVQIGAMSGPEMSLPAALLRSKNLTLRGAGPGSWDPRHLLESLPALLEAMQEIPEQRVKIAKLADIEEEWTAEKSDRLVFVP